MRQIIGLLLFTFLTANIFAQDIQQKNVPAVVLNAFKIKFPNATDVDWRLEKGNYQIKFEVNNKDNKLILDGRGNVVRHHQDLYGSEVPESVLKIIKSKVALYDLDDADRITEGKNIFYEISFEISGKDHDFWIDGNGKLIRYEKELKDSEIPAPITTLIKSKYGSLDIDYARYREESEKISYYIKGEINDKDHDFYFDGNATLLKHNQDLRNSEIPVSIQNTIKARYEGYEIRDADFIEEGKETFYDIELRKSKEKVTLILSPKGKILEIK